jgi:hypothetical protein
MPVAHVQLSDVHFGQEVGVGAWRDRLIAVVSCSRTQVVPGNEISQAYKLMPGQVIARGGSHAV